MSEPVVDVDWEAWIRQQGVECDDERAPRKRCLDCKDTAYVAGRPIRALGLVYETMQPCPTCDLGRCITEGRIRRENEKAAKGQGKKRQREPGEEDLPF